MKDFKSICDSAGLLVKIRWSLEILLFDIRLSFSREKSRLDICRLIKVPRPATTLSTPFKECNVLLLWKVWLDPGKKIHEIEVHKNTSKTEKNDLPTWTMFNSGLRIQMIIAGISGGHIITSHCWRTTAGIPEENIQIFPWWFGKRDIFELLIWRIVWKCTFKLAFKGCKYQTIQFDGKEKFKKNIFILSKL